LHALDADYVAHAIVAVHYGGGLALAHHLELGVHELDAFVDAIDVDRLEAADPVGIDAALVRFDQHRGTDLGLLRRHADGREGFRHEILQAIKGFVIRLFAHESRPPQVSCWTRSSRGRPPVAPARQSARRAAPGRRDAYSAQQFETTFAV
jgi:hypothetical protein